MVLVPPYIEVDGLVARLRVEPPVHDWPARVLLRDDHLKESLLDGLMYVVSGLIQKPAQEVLKLLEERKRLLLSQELSAGPVSLEDAEDFREDAKNWKKLTGKWPDMNDVYHAGASFLSDNIVIPRTTFIKLMTKLYELNDAVREGRLEPRIDESIPLPPPPPEPPWPHWPDEELRELEERARAVDERDPLAPHTASDDVAEWAEGERGFVIAMVEFAYKRINRGETDLPERLAQLGLTTLCSYLEALPALVAYLEDPERLAIVEPAVAAARREAGSQATVLAAELTAAEGFEVTPFAADVSIDLFRHPEALRPPGMTRHQFYAHCEATFLHCRITWRGAETSTGQLFTRVFGRMIRFRYRPEITPVPRLWRIELA